MFTDVKLSEKCNDEKLVQSIPDIAKACEEERWVKRLVFSKNILPYL